MFKKTLAMAAVLGAFAGSAVAADVTLYGVIDTGLAYTHDKTTGHFADVSVNEKSDEFRMDSGNNSATRFGLTGTEDLGNGLTIGFKLENGFEFDSGALSTADTLFDREATISVGSEFGTVYMGRMSTLISDTGSVGFYGTVTSAFGSGWSDNITGHTAVMANYTTRYDNTIAYVSPKFAGLKVYAQYAMGDTAENKHTNDRYAALGARWTAGAFDLGVLVDWLDKDSSAKKLDWSSTSVTDKDIDDQFTFNLGGSFDCGFAKTFLALQYFKDARDVAGIADSIGFYSVGEGIASSEDDVTYEKAVTTFDGYGVHLGTTFDAMGGKVLAGIGYMDGDMHHADDGKLGNVNAYTASLGYEYALSKRTKVYSGMGWQKRELQGHYGTTPVNAKFEAYDVVAGLVHTF